MRPLHFSTVLLLICALTLAPLLPAFPASLTVDAPTCAPAQGAMTDAHAHHGQVDETPNAEGGCMQQDACDGACCTQCAHCFLAIGSTEIAGPGRMSVFAATRLTGRSLLIPALLERPPRLPA